MQPRGDKPDPTLDSYMEVANDNNGLNAMQRHLSPDLCELTDRKMSVVRAIASRMVPLLLMLTHRGCPKPKIVVILDKTRTELALYSCRCACACYR